MKTDTSTATAVHQPEQKPIFGSNPAPRPEVKAGDIFYNPRRGNCLRVLRIYDGHTTHLNGRSELVTYAQCISFRPNGEKGSKTQGIKLASLAEYEPVAFIRVVLADGRVVE